MYLQVCSKSRKESSDDCSNVTLSVPEVDHRHNMHVHRVRQHRRCSRVLCPVMMFIVTSARQLLKLISGAASGSAAFKLSVCMFPLRPAERARVIFD